MTVWGDASLHRGLPNWAARGASSSCPITQLRRKDDDVIRKGQNGEKPHDSHDVTFLGVR